MIHDVGHELACVVVEPVEGAIGTLPADQEFLTEIRRACDAHGILLVMDEIITGFRLGVSGAAGYFGVRADLTTLGKAVGGGMPVGVLCGTHELRDVIESSQMKLSGTFTAHPLTMAAGKAQLDVVLGDPTAYPKLTRLGDALREGVTKAFATVGIPGCATGVGSIWGLHFSSPAPHTPRDVRPNEPAARILQVYLRREGVFFTSSRLGFVSTAHEDEDIEVAVNGMENALRRMVKEGVFEVAER
jgi:glutamate-1-semialdehyde 2,1-aminomutase